MKVTVKFFSNKDSIYQVIQKAMEQNLSLCWIRNTVQDAIQSYQEIKEQSWAKNMHGSNFHVSCHSRENGNPDNPSDLSNKISIKLFHARYALADRLAIEKQVIKSFGKDSHWGTRKKQILIATQVVEQSLDLDFDILISDLSPIDLLIQRAGRLHRHNRDKQGNLIEGKDERGPACLYVYSPSFIESPDSKWYSQFFPNAKTVYPDHGQLWLTAKRLKEFGFIQTPKYTRDLIEGVYGAEAQDQIPKNLSSASEKADGGRKADQCLAHWNSLKIGCGYTQESADGWQDEEKTFTRLGEESLTVYLAKYHEGQLKPWIEEQPWPFSSLSIRSFWIKEINTEGISQDLIDQCKESLPDKGRWSKILPLVYDPATGDWKAYGINKRDQKVCFVYNNHKGLVYC